MLLMVVGLLWLLLGVLTALSFHDEKALSRYELTRLSQSGDKVARELLARQENEQELESLRCIVITLVSSAVVTSSVFSVGIWQGILLGTALLILSPLFVRVSPVRRLADNFRERVRPYALTAAIHIGPILRLLRQREVESAAVRVYSHDELLDVVHRSHGVLSTDQRKRLEANLSFDDKTVAEVMTPKSVIDTADVHDTLGPLVINDLHNTGHSRFPVIEDDIDHVVGTLYLKELIDLRSEHQTVRAAMNPKVYYIHENDSLQHALHGFMRSHHHLFVVVNDYRETVGLLSLEDAIEALIGMKIVDEFDQFDDLRAVAERNPRHNNHPAKRQNI